MGFESYCMFKRVTYQTSDARTWFDKNILVMKSENLEEEGKELKSELCDVKMKFGEITATVTSHGLQV